MLLSEEAILSNYQKYVNFCQMLGDRSQPVLDMIEHLGDRLILAPASSKERFHAAYPGGLVDHSLRVLKYAAKLNKTLCFNLSQDSIIISCLFHDLGKVGDLTSDYYLPQKNEWRRDNLGEQYVINYDIQKMPNAERGLWLMQHFGVKLSLDEWIAIRINDGPSAEENRYYTLSEPTLALLVQLSDRAACHEEKGKLESA